MASIQASQDVLPWLRASGPWELFEQDDLQVSLQRASSSTPLAGLLLLAVLVLVIVETTLARWFSHARRFSRGARSGGFQPTITEAPSGGYTGTGAL